MLTIGKVAQVTLALALPTSIILVYWWYKGRSDDDTYGKKKFVTSRNTVIEVKVPEPAIGFVIGRQGSKIKQIQKDTGASMHFQSKDIVQAGDGDASCHLHRVLVIRGTPESANQAELMVYQVIAGIPNILTEDIQIPAYAIGRIIGKGGGTIKEISSISETKIAIDRNDSLNQDHPRTVTLSGSRKQIDIALELIQIKLEEEEQQRTKLSKADTTKENNYQNEEPKQHAKITAVSRNDESWDMSSSASSPNQDDLLNGTFIDVYVSAVEHPGHFWVQMIGTDALHLEQLQNDITNFASSDDARLNYTVTEVKPGELVAARFDDSDVVYYRAKILGEVDDGKVDLYFVDFGDNVYAKKNDIFRLRSDFTVFPFQAIECILANVVPVGGKWSEEAITLFEDLTHCARWKSLLARVVAYKSLKDDQKTPMLQLFDKGDSKNIDIGAELVKRGYASSLDSLGINMQNSKADVAAFETTPPSTKSRTNSDEMTIIGDS